MGLHADFVWICSLAIRVVACGLRVYGKASFTRFSEVLHLPLFGSFTTLINRALRGACKSFQRLAGPNRHRQIGIPEASIPMPCPDSPKCWTSPPRMGKAWQVLQVPSLGGLGRRNSLVLKGSFSEPQAPKPQNQSKYTAQTTSFARWSWRLSPSLLGLSLEDFCSLAAQSHDT